MRSTMRCSLLAAVGSIGELDGVEVGTHLIVWVCVYVRRHESIREKEKRFEREERASARTKL